MRGNMQRGGGRGGRGGAITGRSMVRSHLLGNQSNSVRRLQKDYAELRNAEVPLYGVSAAPLEDSMYTWHANIRGPKGTKYEGGVFHMEIVFPQDYPCSPPTMRLMTDIPHPNVFSGSISLDMCRKNRSGNWYEGWCSMYTIESILIQMQSFLFDESTATQLVIPDEAKDKLIKNAIQNANAFRCTQCKHKGPGEPYPPFNVKETEEEAYTILKSPKQLLGEELLCYHTRARFPEVALGIGVSRSRLPRTGEIRSVQPTIDLLSLKAFTKQKLRQSIDNERFTHWLPLYFGEKDLFEVKKANINEDNKQEVVTVDPRQRFERLIEHSICFLTKGSTKKEMTPEMVIEVMPKLIVTHMVNIADEKKHHSIQAIRRLVNFFRLFRYLISLRPKTEDILNEQLNTFINEPAKRVKDYCSSLGDILSNATISSKFRLKDVIQSYIEEQLDRQVFWILRVIPEMDHTDEEFKSRSIILEDARADACFKTGLVGFRITMLFHTLNEIIESHYGKDWGAFESQVDGNFGCMDSQIEDMLQQKLKQMKRVESFQEYYKWIGVDCRDEQALQARLRQAIENSKEKKYHGSSEHMNYLPEIEDQVKEFLMKEPSPFVHMNGKVFLDGKAPEWKAACMAKFSWLQKRVNWGNGVETPTSLAKLADERGFALDIPEGHSVNTAVKENQVEVVNMNDIIHADYNDFTWRDLYHKLCFEQMLDNFTKLKDFKVMYDYINHIGPQITELRIAVQNKQRLKSNHYWMMILVTKLTNLKSIKIHSHCSNDVTLDFFKFFVKGLNYAVKEGRSFTKFQMKNTLTGNNCQDYLYQCLKLNKDLVSLDFSKLTLTFDSAKAIGRVLSDFHNVREINISDVTFATNAVKEIADGLMRAKKLEVLKMRDNASMKDSASQIVYNLAFSPKIRVIDFGNSPVGYASVAESIFKLVKISGAIEVLNLENTGLRTYLTRDFYVSLGDSKTLNVLNLSEKAKSSRTAWSDLGRAVGMNSYKGGMLRVLKFEHGFSNYSAFQQFFNGLSISKYDHEMMYGDTKLASTWAESNKEALEKKLYFDLTHFDFKGSSIDGIWAYDFKKMVGGTVDWPIIVDFAISSAMDLNLSQTGLKQKQMESFYYMLSSDNPRGQSKIRSLNLSRNMIKKDGARIFTPALKTNSSLLHLDLSSCYLGVSGVVHLSNNLAENQGLKSLNLYRNHCDVDGARALGKALATNKTLSFLDIGHNRIRITGLRAIVQGIRTNSNSAITDLGVCANFINDEGISYLLDELVIPGAGHGTQLKKLYIQNNFLSEFHKRELGSKIQEFGLIGKVYIDAFEACPLLEKEVVDRSIWVAPLAEGQKGEILNTFFSLSKKCGFVIDVRVRKGKDVPKRTRKNVFAVIEYAHENSIPRSLQVASKGKAIFNGISARVYKAGTKTAVNFPKQSRK